MMRLVSKTFEKIGGKIFCRFSMSASFCDLPRACAGEPSNVRFNVVVLPYAMRSAFSQRARD
jgi:hypothetical protein